MKEQKAQASSSHNWNTLFLGANAVATLMAERYDTTKQQVLLISNNAFRFPFFSDIVPNDSFIPPIILLHYRT